MLSLWQEVMVDLINTADPAARAAEVEALGVDIVCVHTAFDVQHHSDPLQELRAVRGAVNRYVESNTTHRWQSVYSRGRVLG